MHYFCFLNGDHATASARERVLRYSDGLAREGITLDTHVAGAVAPGLAGRAKYWLDLSRRLLRADGILIHRVPLSGKERTLLRASRKPAIFDVDDAIWVTMDDRPSPREKDLVATIKLCRTARAGNEELARYLRDLGVEVRIAPTCVPLAEPRPRAPGPVRIGWIGHSVNLPYLSICEEAIHRISDARLTVVADRAYEGADFHPWSVGCEERLLPLFDIGIMPLPDTVWTRGKCGYKLLLYMSHAIPVVASPVGANREIVKDGETGFFARTADEWHDRLRALIDDAALRKRIGWAGRASIEGEYDEATGLAALVRDLREAAE